MDKVLIKEEREEVPAQPEPGYQEHKDIGIGFMPDFVHVGEKAAKSGEWRKECSTKIPTWGPIALAELWLGWYFLGGGGAGGR